MNQAKKIAKESKSSFYHAFNLLPKEKSLAMNTVYAFCRKTDDIVDENSDSDEIKLINLINWKNDFEKALNGSSDNPLLEEVAAAIRKFSIPVDPFFDLIKGMEMDIRKNRYQTFEELELYCYRAASTVGLMSIEIFGYKDEKAKLFAVDLGKAMQLTNILRDVYTDSKIGRIYLPLEDLEKFNYTEEDVFNRVYNDNFYLLMKYEADRARKYFNNADRNLIFEDKQSMFAARAMQHIYFNLLNKLEKQKFRIYEEKINVSKAEKLLIALGVWAKYKFIY